MQKPSASPTCALVFDLETCPDPTWRDDAVVQLDESKPATPPARSFAPPAFHQVVCIAAIRLRWQDAAWITDAVGAPTIADHAENQLIENFLSAVDRDSAKLVGFNSLKFDLAVLRYRGMLHKISAPALTRRSAYYRFGENHTDLCDILSCYDPRDRLSLDRTCRALQLPGKLDGTNGNDVADLVAAGEYGKLAAYAVRDVVITTLLFLRHELFCGRLTRAAHDRSTQALAAFLRGRPERFPATVLAGLEERVGP